MAVFIATWRDDRYWLVGPFDNDAEAANWNRVEENNPSDDPRWQVLNLADPHAPPVVLSPAMAAEVANQKP